MSEPQGTEAQLFELLGRMAWELHVLRLQVQQEKEPKKEPEPRGDPR